MLYNILAVGKEVTRFKGGGRGGGYQYGLSTNQI